MNEGEIADAPHLGELPSGESRLIAHPGEARVSMPIRVTLSAIADGMVMQSDEMTSYLHRPTGRVIILSDEAIQAAENDDEEWDSSEELADARNLLTAHDEYVALPDRLSMIRSALTPDRRCNARRADWIGPARG